MGQAYDNTGQPIGEEVSGKSMEEVFNKIRDQKLGEAEIRLTKFRETLPKFSPEQAFFSIDQRLDALEKRMDILIAGIKKEI